MKFKIEIELGNDTMRTGEHVRDALLKAAQHVARDYLGTDFTRMKSTLDAEGPIKDANGNRVGTWEVDGGYKR